MAKLSEKNKIYFQDEPNDKISFVKLDEDGNTVFHKMAGAASNEKKLGSFLKNITSDLQDITDKNPKNNRGMTPLHQAACSSSFTMCEMIIEYVEDISPLNHAGLTPLHMAVMRGDIKIIDMFLKNLKIKEDDENGPPNYTVIKNHQEISDLLIKCEEKKEPVNDQIRTPLHYSADEESLEICQMLLQNRKNINPADKNGFTPLHLAARKGHFSIVKQIAIASNVQDKNPKSKNTFNTPLHEAANNGKFEICEYILNYLKNSNSDDKNINPKNFKGRTPLHMAAGIGHLKICKLIIDIIEDKNPEDDEGNTPLHLAAKYGCLTVFGLIFKIVKEKNPTNKNGHTPLDLADGRIGIHSLLG